MDLIMGALEVNLGAVETDRIVAQTRIDQKRNGRERNKLGQFATPAALAVDITRAAQALMEDEVPIHFGEPAMGTGAFISALRTIFPKNRIASMLGIEIDPAFAAAARELWEPSGVQVVEGDFTLPFTWKRSAVRPTLILTNPPYVRHHHLNQEQKTRLCEQAFRSSGISVNGLAGLYVYFMLIAHEWMADGCLATWLVPSEFMDVNYGEALRRYLTERVSLIGIHRFDPADVQFTDALVSSTVVTFRKVTPSPGTVARLTFGGSVTAPIKHEDVMIAELRRARKWTSFPRQESLRTANRPPAGEAALGDLFRIQRGIVTGSNGFFILPRARALDLGLPDSCLRPILASPRHVRLTEVPTDPDGYPHVDPQMVLLDCDIPESEVRERHPALWNYLCSVSPEVREAYLVRNRQPWYRQEKRKPTPFLCTYMGRGMDEVHPVRFILNRSQAIAANVYLMLYPKEPLAALLRERRDLTEVVFQLLQEITANDLREEGRVYGGGLHKIEPSELGRISARRFTDAIPELAAGPLGQLSLF